MARLAVIVPTLNESKNPLFAEILDALAKVRQVEILFVDGRSQDETVALIRKRGFRCLELESQSRADRLNYGIQRVSSDYVLLHHPRSVVVNEAIEELLTRIERAPSILWGGFSHQFDLDHYLLKFTSWYSNWIRARLRSIVYLDHCIFVRTDILRRLYGVPPVAIFEDTLLSLKLRTLAKPVLLKSTAKTSAIRFKRNGVWRQALLNQRLKWAFYFGASKQVMNDRYEKNLELNSPLS